MSEPATAALPVIFDIDAMAYGYFTVRQHARRLAQDVLDFGEEAS